MQSMELQTNFMHAECLLELVQRLCRYSPCKSILNIDVMLVFMGSFVREYPGRGYVQESNVCCLLSKSVFKVSGFRQLSGSDIIRVNHVTFP